MKDKGLERKRRGQRTRRERGKIFEREKCRGQNKERKKDKIVTEKKKKK